MRHLAPWAAAMTPTQIGFTALAWGLVGLFDPRAGWLVVGISGLIYLLSGGSPYCGWSWSAPCVF